MRWHQCGEDSVTFGKITEMLPICCLCVFFSIIVMRPYLILYYDFTWIFWKGNFRLWDLETLPNNQSEKSINIYIRMNRESFGLWQCRWSWHTSASSKTRWRPEEGNLICSSLFQRSDLWAAFPSEQCPQRESRIKLFLSSIYTGHFIHKERMHADIEGQRKEKATKMNREEITWDRKCDQLCNGNFLKLRNLRFLCVKPA